MTEDQMKSYAEQLTQRLEDAKTNAKGYKLQGESFEFMVEYSQGKEKAYQDALNIFYEITGGIF